MGEEGLALARTIVNSLEEKKGEDILLLDLEGVCSFTDFFVICSGGSERTLKALADEVWEGVRQKHDLKATSIEGDAASGWVLMDYGYVIVHLLSPYLRDYYRLEDLWNQGRIVVHVR
jgi:ribosome-associated protein